MVGSDLRLLIHKKKKTILREGRRQIIPEIWLMNKKITGAELCLESQSPHFNNWGKMSSHILIDKSLGRKCSSLWDALVGY